MIRTIWDNLTKYVYAYSDNIPSSMTPKARITYSTHSILQNMGPTISVEENLTPQLVCSTLSTNPDLSDKVKQNINIIDEALNREDLLEKLDGVFIHDKFNGLVLIKKNDKLKYVVSVLI